MADEAPDPALIQRLEGQLDPPPRNALDACRRLCDGRDAGLFLVGGAVRDLVLDRGHGDLDLAVEAEVASIAQALAAVTGGRAVLHARFDTATVSGPGFHLDLARTRREAYARPGALPTVEPASIYEDLARRDFTVNAMALRLTQPAGELLDPLGGLADIRGGVVRVLHDASFRDDATRILRAVRYAARLDFSLDAETERRLRRDLAYLDTISGPRLRRELALLFEEERAVEGTQLAARLGVLRAVHPAFGLDEATADRWRRALTGTHHAPPDELGFCVVARPVREEDVASLTERLHLTGRIERALTHVVRLQRLSDKLATASPATAVELLERQAPAAVWALAVMEGGAVERVCLAYLEEWRRLKPHLSGDDLMALGVPPGTAVGEALRALRRARLEGQTSTRDDEIALVRAGFRPKSGD